MQYAVFAWQNGTGLVDLWRAGFAYRPERQVPPGVGYTVIGLWLLESASGLIVKKSRTHRMRRDFLFLIGCLIGRRDKS